MTFTITIISFFHYVSVALQIVAVCLLVQVVLAVKSPTESVCDKVCAQESKEKLPYPGDCTKFCHCGENGNLGKNCPAGLHFNPELEECDWPENAGCIDSLH